jgi:hypothetical protein
MAATLIPSRRGVLTGFVAAPVLSAAAIAGATADDMEALFGVWKSAFWEINHCLESVDDGHPAMMRLDKAENEIIRRRAVHSPRAAAMRLWIALGYVMPDKKIGEAIVREDIATVVCHSGPEDWEVKCIIQALCALTGYSGELN